MLPNQENDAQICPVVAAQVDSASSDEKAITPPHSGNINWPQPHDRHKHLLIQSPIASAGLVVLPDR